MISYIDTDADGAFVAIFSAEGDVLVFEDGLPTVEAALSYSRAFVAEQNISPRWAKQARHYEKYGW